MQFLQVRQAIFKSLMGHIWPLRATVCPHPDEPLKLSQNKLVRSKNEWPLCSVNIKLQIYPLTALLRISSEERRKKGCFVKLALTYCPAVCKRTVAEPRRSTALRPSVREKLSGVRLRTFYFGKWSTHGMFSC